MGELGGEGIQKKVKGGLVTERDVEIVRWLGRHRLATAEQVMRGFGMHRTKAYDRLRLLASEGMVRFEEGVRSKRVYLATPAGQKLVGLDLPRATVSAASFAHDIIVVDAAIDLERSTSLRVLTERELRRQGAGSANPYRLRLPCTDNESRYAWPDLVVEDLVTGTVDAIEIELTLKTKRRLQEKLIAYGGSEYRAVVYMTGNRAVRQAIREITRELGLHGRVEERAIGAHGSDIKPAEDALEQLRTDVERMCADHAHETRQAQEHAAMLDARQRKLVHELRTFVDGDRGVQRRILDRWREQLPSEDR